MFTVIIAEQKTLELFDERKPFLQPLLSEDIAFCSWNPEGESVDEMLLGIYEITKYHKQWRALVVYPDGLEQINPFDFTKFACPSVKGSAEKAEYWEQLEKKRQTVLDCFDLAVTNPLTKLTCALCKPATFPYQLQSEETMQAILGGDMPLYAYMLRAQLNDLNLRKTAEQLDQYRRDKLLRFVDEESTGALIEAVRTADVPAILNMVELPDVVPFIRFLSDDDLLHSDPEYNECLIENTYKDGVLRKLREDYFFRDSLPEEVICVAARTVKEPKDSQETAWKKLDEADYSRFAEFNLYPDALKLLVFDLVPAGNRQYESDRLRMLSFLLLLAANTLPAGSVKTQQLYRADLMMDDSVIHDVFSEYLGKLKATSQHIHELARDIDMQMQEPLDNRTSRELFESEITIPVEIQEYSHGDMKADSGSIGLAKDCPESEWNKWNGQYYDIEKRFMRYMREPQRALKAAVSGEFRRQNTIDDERVHQLNENQKEDIRYKMLDEESQMIQEQTPQIFDLESYKKDMRKEHERVRSEIRKRMEKRRILALGGVSAAALLFGFLPLFFANLNTIRSFGFTILLSAVGIALLLVGGLVFLFGMRRQMRRAIHRFNDAMNAICWKVESGLQRFSAYLSHACNMMRESSALNVFDSSAMKKKKILAYHDMHLREAGDSAVELFSKFMDCSSAAADEQDPFDYDYTVMGDYKYPIPYSTMTHRIDFLQKGNEIETAADFVVAVTMDRVELYE